MAVRTFAATAGTVVAVTRPDFGQRYEVWSPNGQVAYSSQSWDAGLTSRPITLPESGTYRLVAVPTPSVSLLDTMLSVQRRSP